MRPVRWKLPGEIEDEWNVIASVRLGQIRGQKDLSYAYVLKPCVLELCTDTDLTNVLDIGCGVGQLSIELASKAVNVIGVDISSESLRLARATAGERRGLSFEKIAAEELESRFAHNSFSLAIANMSLSVINNLSRAVSSIASVVRPGGHFIITIPHPWFWPTYAGFDQAEWFRYGEEIPIEWEFRISLEQTGYRTTFIHRPLAGC
jgi:SAM-dependent methyltransferase